MRLDKYLCENTNLTRTLAKKAISNGEVTINGTPAKKGSDKITENDEVYFEGTVIDKIGFRYIMLHKPQNMICSTIDEAYPSVLNLLDIVKRERLRIAGRLDVDTTGLVLVSDDGAWLHQIASPNQQCDKCYHVSLAEPLKGEEAKIFGQGLLLRGEEKPTKPAKLETVSSKQVKLTISEGKYHQVKRMFAAVGNRVTALHRASIGAVLLDPELKEGEWRYLTHEEIKALA
ncbi:pseudouridine synthase [Algicola sagamiensis]|uniref:pseudouridine synthase n=1 Tax=Algicola sagamiensis TaxID=163869 RepID=UPI00037276CB|nr:pseudouridine synthase [Algicola sagamiensis]